MKFQGHLLGSTGRRGQRELPRPNARSVFSALQAWAVATGNESSEVEDEFSAAIIDALNFEPLSFEVLHPLHWQTPHPHLAVRASLHRGVVDLSVAPVVSRTQASNQGRPSYEDFFRFDAPLQGTRPWVRVLHLEIGAYEPEPQKAALRRKTVQALYEYAVSKLAISFNCELEAALVCFGPDNSLTVRTLQEEAGLPEVEFANLLTYDPQLWHPRLAELSKAAHLTPREALELFNSSFKHISRASWQKAWADYTGVKQDPYAFRPQRGPGFDEAEVPELLRVLAIMDDPKSYPPLTSGNREATQAYIRELHTRHGVDLVSAVQGRYELTHAQAWNVIRDYLPDVHRDLPRSPHRLVDELTQLQGEETGAALAKVLGDRLVEWAQQTFDQTVDRWDLRLRRTLSGIGMRHTELLRWAEVNAPALVEWRDHIDATYRPQPRKVKTPAKEKAPVKGPL